MVQPPLHLQKVPEKKRNRPILPWLAGGIEANTKETKRMFLFCVCTIKQAANHHRTMFTSCHLILLLGGVDTCFGSACNLSIPGICLYSSANSLISDQFKHQCVPIETWATGAGNDTRSCGWWQRDSVNSAVFQSAPHCWFYLFNFLVWESGLYKEQCSFAMSDSLQWHMSGCSECLNPFKLWLQQNIVWCF